MAWTVGGASAHGTGPQETKAFSPTDVEQKAFGQAGDPGKARRTMIISMSDTMRFSPSVLDVKQGETIRFVVRNDGRTLHELVLGTRQELAQHAELMRKFPGMKHDEPHMVHVQPGQSEQFVWTFNRPGTFEFACLLPGHFEAGMVGKVVVR